MSGPPSWLKAARQHAKDAGVKPADATHLDLSGKYISNTAGIEEFRGVVALFLLDNQIETLQGLHTMTRLKHLYIQNNLIGALRGLEGCRSLEKLYANNNFLTRLEGLQGCTSLVELHLQCQQMPPGTAFSFEPASLQALAGCLTHLNLSHCNVQQCAPLGTLRSLQRLDLSSNAIASFADVAEMLAGAASLTSLDLRHNPVAGQRRWRREALGRGAALQVLDERTVTPMERENVAHTTAVRPGPMHDLEALDVRRSVARPGPSSPRATAFPPVAPSDPHPPAVPHPRPPPHYLPRPSAAAASPPRGSGEGPLHRPERAAGPRPA